MTLSGNAFITAEDIARLEQAGYALYRSAENELAVSLLALALRLRSATGIGTPAIFACDVDESAGMAEVVELHGWSRKAPCA